jgi:hypothetical protein
MVACLMSCSPAKWGVGACGGCSVVPVCALSCILDNAIMPLMMMMMIMMVTHASTAHECAGDTNALSAHDWLKCLPPS